MGGNSEIIRYFQANRILAKNLDRALAGVEGLVKEQIDLMSKGATRIAYYTSCFTEEYSDICKRQGAEDIRFKNAVIKMFMHGDVAKEMFRIYFEQILKYKTNEQLEHIKKGLMDLNTHIAASSLTGVGFSLALASSVRVGLGVNLQLSALAGQWATRGLAVVGIYGVVQKAADSARHLLLQFPEYYSALYEQELEMLYFLIEPIFQNADAFQMQHLSNEDIIRIINRMI